MERKISFFLKSAIVLMLIGLSCCGHQTNSNTARDNAAIVFAMSMRAVRMHETLLDSMGHPYEYVGWNTKGEFKKITETAWISSKQGGKDVTMMMFRYLLIPNAPWLSEFGSIYKVVRNGARAEKFGQKSMHSLKVPGHEEMVLFMFKTAETNGKWVGLTTEKDEKAQRIYECSDDGTGTQIGWLAYKNLTIESGETVKVFMTKGMAPGSVWEGDVGNVFYREAAEGKGTPIAKLEYRPMILEDGTETVILVSRPLKGSTIWKGVRDGKVIEFRESKL